MRLAYLVLPLVAASSPGCLNTCSWSSDFLCDDGGEGSHYSVCAFGTDCDDCGSRTMPPPASPPPPYSPSCSAAVDLVLILDESGSMSSAYGSIAADVKRFAASVVMSFSLGASLAKISIIKFSTVCEVDLSLSDSREEAMNVISSYSPSGGTCISCALEAARNELDSNGRGESGVPGYVFLLTDGVQTSPSGSTDKDAILQATLLKAAGHTLYAVGFAGAAEQTLQAPANSSPLPSRVFPRTTPRAKRPPCVAGHSEHSVLPVCLSRRVYVRHQRRLFAALHRSGEPERAAAATATAAAAARAHRRAPAATSARQPHHNVR